MPVNEAKRQVFGTVGVDLLPGPSEVMIIADKSANPEFTAAALLAQAEHGSGKEKVYFLFSDQRKAFTDTEKQIHKQIGSLVHKTAIEHVLKVGFFGIHVPEFEKIPEVANFIAPEHLEIQVSETKENFLLEKITTAGALLIGHYTATALGDFLAGPSHVLPTGRSALFFGLKVDDFCAVQFHKI